MNLSGKPDAGNLHVRFDEGDRITPVPTLPLAALESFAFGLHAIGASLAPHRFGLSPDQLEGVHPGQVADVYSSVWKGSDIAAKLKALVDSTEYTELKQYRNVLAHRAVPARHFILRNEARNESIWGVDDAGVSGASTSLDNVPVHGGSGSRND